MAGHGVARPPDGRRWTIAPAASSSRSSATSGSTSSSETGRRTVRDRRRDGLAQGERRVLREDHLLQRAGLRGRLEAPLLVEGAARRLVRVERLLLPAGPGEREHQETAEALAVRVLRSERGSIGDHVVVAPELDLGLDAVLERREPELVQPRDLCLEEALVSRGRQTASRARAPSASRSPADRSAGGSGRASWTSRSNRLASIAPGSTRSTYPGARVSIAAFPSRRRSRETAFCTIASAVGGGAPAQRSSIRVSVETTEPACSTRSASTARCLGPPSGIRSRPARASSGPSTRNSTRRSPFRVRRRYSSTRPKYRAGC